MRALHLILTILFVVTVEGFHLRKYFQKQRDGVYQRRIRDPMFADNFLGSNEEYLTDVEYDVESDIRDFKEQLDRLRSLNRKVEEKSNEHVRREKDVSSDLSQEREKGEENEGGVRVRITKHIVNYLKEKVLAILQHDTTRSRPSRIVTSWLGMNVSIDNLQIVDFVRPEMNVEMVDQNTVQITTSGGGAKLLGGYSAVYLTKREGQFEGLIKGFGLDFKMKYIKTFQGGLKVIDHTCAFAAKSIDILLQPRLADEIVGSIKEQIGRRLNSNICTGIETYLNTASKELSQSISFINPLEAQARNFSSEVVFDNTLVEEVSTSSKFVEMSLAGGFKSNKTTFDGAPQKLQMEASDDSKMAYVYLSDYTFNSFFHQLTSYGDVIFNLHVIPEIASFLRTRCPEFEVCMGIYANIKSVDEGSGRLVLRTRSAPRIQMVDGAAIVSLQTSVDISYRTSDSLLDVPTTFITYDADITLRLTRLNIDRTPTGQYAWTAKIGIEEITTSNVRTDRSEMEKFAENIQLIMDKTKKHLESLLSANIRPIVPIRTNRHVEFTSITSEFRQNTLVIGFDVDLDSHLFPRFVLVK